MINKKPTDWINSENLYMWGVPNHSKDIMRILTQHNISVNNGEDLRCYEDSNFLVYNNNGKVAFLDKIVNNVFIDLLTSNWI